MLLCKLNSTTTLLRLTLCCIACSMVSSTLLHAQSSTFKRPKIAKSGPYANSDILVSGDKHTVVPKNAVLFVPENMSHRKVSKPTGKFTIWPRFQRNNYGWLYKLEVTLDQASGKKPLTKEKLERLKSMGKVVVAVYKNNPISVRPAKNDQ